MEDEPVLKPRQARGTPLLKYRRNLLLKISFGFMVIYKVTEYFINERFERKIAVGWYDQTRAMKEKRMRMSSFGAFPSGTSAQILEALKNDRFEKEAAATYSPEDGDLRD